MYHVIVAFGYEWILFHYPSLPSSTTTTTKNPDSEYHYLVTYDDGFFDNDVVAVHWAIPLPISVCVCVLCIRMFVDCVVCVESKKKIPDSICGVHPSINQSNDDNDNHFRGLTVFWLYSGSNNNNNLIIIFFFYSSDHLCWMFDDDNLDLTLKKKLIYQMFFPRM